MKTILVVANETIGGRPLIEAVRRHATGEESRFVLCVPQTRPRSGLVIYDDSVFDSAQARVDLAVAFVRREGIWLAAGVMVLDVVANWTGNWPSLQEDPARLLRPVGLLPITLFGVFVLVTTLPLLRVMKD